uniref:Midecamycin 4''-O-propionyl transferase n=1 Tax=Streptomyces mycarofaciens TaxID=1949 RepID=Q54466_STRMY|nr:midecamycin 4''-O-propionyl transferase [Streptomyces mycarofaciens]
MPLPKHLPSLGGMRAIAALVVFWSHIASQTFFRKAEINSTAQVPLDVLGPVAVFFFMLSGFVLTWAGMPDPSKPAFWRRRWVRVYSLHLPVLLLTLAIVLWLKEPNMGGSVWDGFLSNLLLVQSWCPDYHQYGSMNPVAWSLSCEMLFYAAFPFLFAFFSKMRAERLWSWVLGISVVAAAVPALALLLPSAPTLPWDPNMPELQYWFIYMLRAVRLLEFALGGVLMAQIVRRGRWIGPTPGVCALLFAGAFAVSFALPSYLARDGPTVPLIALLLGSLAAGDIRGTRSWLGTRTMVLLGELTFAFYVIHYLVIQYGHRFLGGELSYYRQWDTPAAIGLTVLALGLSVGLAALLHFFVEKPVVRALGRSGKASRASKAPQPEPPAPLLS